MPSHQILNRRKHCTYLNALLLHLESSRAQESLNSPSILESYALNEST